LITRIHHPAPPLALFIDYFYYYTGFAPVHSVDRFLPDGEVQVIFDLTDYPKYIYDNQTLKEIQSCRKVWFSGFRTEPITIPSGKESEMVIVQFRKGKALPFLKEPMYTLTNTVVDAELVMEPALLDIRDQLVEETTPERKLYLLEKRLSEIYSKQLFENIFIDYAVSRILASPDSCSIGDISDRAGYSHKTMIRYFREHVGVTPKEFLKVVRFQKAILQIENQGKVDWQEVAFDCGFYDQSHFIADFRCFSGFTPTDYLRSRGEFLNYIPVG